MGGKSHGWQTLQTLTNGKRAYRFQFENAHMHAIAFCSCLFFVLLSSLPIFLFGSMRGGLCAL